MMDSRNRMEEIYEDVKKRILAGELKENTKVSERYLCEQYDTSRTTVRGAINKLKNDGWLHVQPKSGTFVAPVDTKAIRYNFQFRVLLEPNLILLAAPHMTKADLTRMRRNCDCMEVEGPERYGYCEADNHNVIAERAGNPLVLRTFHELMDNILRITSKAASGEATRKKNSVREWRKIIDALETGDAYMARQFMIQHIENASDAFWEKFDQR